MPTSDQEYVYRISVDDFDKSLLPVNARTPGTDEFSQAVNQVLRQEYAEFGGWVQIVVDQKSVQVTWKADPSRPAPLDVIVRTLEEGKRAEAIRLLQHLRRHEPDNIKVLCNLGMVWSDLGQLDKAEELLRHALNVDPQHVPARLALGVVLVRQGNLNEAADEFRQVVEQEPSNALANKNLAGTLARLGQFAHAEPYYRKAVALNPADQQASFDLAKLLIRLERASDADELFAYVIDLDSTTTISDEARRYRTKLTQADFRSAMPSDVRPDAVMYLLGAIKKFDAMRPEQVQQIGFEIATLGQKGLDTKDTSQKYTLKSLPGNFSGLHLVCLMFVAFKIVAPHHDMGFDLEQEYDVAQTMRRKEGPGGGKK